MSKLLLLAFSFSSLVAAQSVGDLDKRLGDLEKAAKAAQSAGDNAWMLTSAALVLMMTGPGLALFYGGLVRRKNVLSTMMHSFVLMAVVSVLWAVIGYSMAFGEGNSFVGGSTCSCTVSGRSPTATMRPPSRRPPSWCIS